MSPDAIYLQSSVAAVAGEECYTSVTTIYSSFITASTAVSPDAIYLQTSVTAVAGEESFSVRGRQLLRPGWLALYSRSSIEDDADDGGDRGEEDEEGGEVCNCMFTTTATGLQLFVCSGLLLPGPQLVALRQLCSAATDLQLAAVQAGRDVCAD